MACEGTPIGFVKPKRGRPRKLTRELLAVWEELLPAVGYIDTVAKFLEIHRTTWGKWLERGKSEAERMLREGNDLALESEVIYLDFFYVHKRALAQGEIMDMAKIQAAGQAGAWKALAWRLERRFPERYGSQAREIKALRRELAELRSIAEAFKSREMELAAAMLRIEQLESEVSLLQAQLADAQRNQATALPTIDDE